MQKWLLTEGDVKLKKCIKIAQSMETLHRNTKTSSSELTIGKVTETSKGIFKASHQGRLDENPSKPYYRCGKSASSVQNYSHKNNTTCHKRSKKGHLARACLSSRKQSHNTGTTVGAKGQTIGNLTRNNPLTQDIIRQTVLRVGSGSPQHYKVTLELNGRPMWMEIDTGAAVSITSPEKITRKNQKWDIQLKSNLQISAIYFWCKWVLWTPNM